MKKRVVVAYDESRYIGRDGELPWGRALPADLEHFRRLTLGQTVIMGRSTFESIGRPLPRRQNIVVSRLSDLALQGVQVARTLEGAYALAEEDPYVIGGGQLYRAALPMVDTVYATEVGAQLGGDTSFPELSPRDWSEVQRIAYDQDEKNAYPYAFVTYERTKE